MKTPGQIACEKAREYLDSYISSELLVETNHEMLQHIERCPACTAEFEARSRLRTRLKAAVEATSVPADLQARVRQRIQSRRLYIPAWSGSSWTHWAMPAAAMAAVVVCAGLWLRPSLPPLPDNADRPGQRAFIERISVSLGRVLKAGLSDHVHCAIFRDHTQKPPALEVMKSQLGPGFDELLPVVKTGIPEGFRVVLAHHCTTFGRKFTHVTMQRGTTEVLSLVITEKQPGESLDGLKPSAQPAGIPIYESGAERYQVAGFEAGRYFAFIVSELRPAKNLQVAETIAPAVRGILMKITA